MSSPWMNIADLQVYLRKPSTKAVRHWIRAYGVPTAATGQVLVHRVNVDRVLAGLAPRPLSALITR